jgi:hypothetical protein
MRLTTSMQGDLGMGLGGQAQQPGPNGKPAEKFAVNAVALLRQQLIVKMTDNQFYVLTFYAPLNDRAEATATFDAVAGSLEIYDPTEMRKKRVDAIKLGKEWLGKQTAEEFKGKMAAQPQWFKMLVGGAKGTEVGGLKFEEVEIANKDGLRIKNRNGFEGVQLEMTSWAFSTHAQYGEVTTLGENYAFWAYAKNKAGVALPHYSMWANLSKTQAKVPVAGGGGRLADQEFWLLETGILNLEVNGRLTAADIEKAEADRMRLIENSRNLDKLPPPIVVVPTQYHLNVTVTGDPGQRVPPALDLRIPPQEASPLPKIMEYVWPRLVDLTKASEMTFVVYNKDLQKLALRTLIVTGKKEYIEVNGRAQECFKCIDEMDPGSTTVWVDREGRIVSMRTSDQTVLVPTNPAELRQKWGARMAMK